MEFQSSAVSSQSSIVFSEGRYWQIAVDIVCGAAGFTDIGSGVCRGSITTTGAGTFTIPSDWTDTNTIQVIGRGGGDASDLTYASGGGGGGGYASVSDLCLGLLET